MYPRKRGVSIVSVQALPDLITVQKSEESIGVGYMYVCLCQYSLWGREWGGSKGGGHFARQDTGTVRDKDVPGSISESAAFQAPGTRE